MVMKKLQQKVNKTAKVNEYSSIFLKPTDIVARYGKSAYIAPGFHEKISRIVFILGKGKITISDYLNNVLKKHFEDYYEQIRVMHNEMIKPIL